MTTNGRGSRRKLPASTPMSADEAAPALAAALHAADIAAAPLVPPGAATMPLPTPTTALAPSSKPDSDPAPTTDFASAPFTADAHEEPTMDTTETAASTGAMFSDLSARAKGAMDKGTQMFAEMTEFNKGTAEAVVESSRIAARGMESMGQDAAAYAKTSFEAATSAMRELASVKSPTEFMRLQADFARKAFDAMVAQTSRSTETTLKLAGEVAQPISTRMAIAAERMKVPA
jgi:phasin family protein